MHVLRAEKGFIIVGQETDGSTTPIDLDMDWIISKKKYDFIGKRALSRSDTIKKDRKQLVGILTKDPNEILEEGAQLVEKESTLPMTMVGHITSSYYSPNLGRSFALALVKGGINKKGCKLLAPMPNKTIEVEITSPVFIDPSNERLSAYKVSKRVRAARLALTPLLPYLSLPTLPRAPLCVSKVTCGAMYKAPMYTLATISLHSCA